MPLIHSHCPFVYMIILCFRVFGSSRWVIVQNDNHSLVHQMKFSNPWLFSYVPQAFISFTWWTLGEAIRNVMDYQTLAGVIDIVDLSCHMHGYGAACTHYAERTKFKFCSWNSHDYQYYHRMSLSRSRAGNGTKEEKKRQKRSKREWLKMQVLKWTHHAVCGCVFTRMPDGPSCVGIELFAGT